MREAVCIVALVLGAEQSLWRVGSVTDGRRGQLPAGGPADLVLVEGTLGATCRP